MKVPHKRILTSASKIWDPDIILALSDYIKIPNCSPAFPQNDNLRETNRAVELLVNWAKSQPIRGLDIGVVRLENRTPLIFIEVPGTAPGTVLMYGHLDKQPPLSGWRDGLGPYTPVLEEGKLYGRGGADDGYSIFTALTALRLLGETGIPRARCVIMIEACEESGSPDLPAYVEALAGKIGEPDLMIGLDSECGDYDRLWATTSLRGCISASLRVEILTEGVHSGKASGIVPSTFRILRQLLSRIEDEETGEILLRSLQVFVPLDRWEEIKNTASVLGNKVYESFPFVTGANQVAGGNTDLIIKNTWRPTLCVTGMNGIPTLEGAGNVLRPFTDAKLSIRIPPMVDAKAAYEKLRTVLEAEPPYGAKVTFGNGNYASGWNAPTLAPWLSESIDSASKNYFGKEPMFMGVGGTIPFMQMLAERFPLAQFLITGVLGPNSNAHGPNEFLHIPAVKKLTACVAQVIADHASAQMATMPDF
ncbi:MAG: M20/M25/M40 family metallo-hydrolase [Candidatus Liptonbacteria bacterium]|nr:M20/M25/M40 family metallo-hydrolase [Candidatus Liptonbacteria bacterium]